MDQSIFFIRNNLAKEGNKSLYFYSDSMVNSVSVSNEIKVTPNTNYTLSGWLLNNLNSGYFYIDWLEYDAYNQPVVDGSGIYSRNTNRWEWGGVTFQTNPSTVKIIARVVVDGNAAGHGYADGIQLVEGANPFLLHQSFEIDDPHWDYSSSYFSRTTHDSAEGQTALKFDSPIMANLTAESGMLQVTPSTSYTLSGWIQDHLLTGNAYIDWLEYGDANNLIVDGGNIIPSVKNNWSFGSMDFTTSPNTTYVLVRIVVDGNASGEAYGDGIALRKN